MIWVRFVFNVARAGLLACMLGPVGWCGGFLVELLVVGDLFCLCGVFGWMLGFGLELGGSVRLFVQG